MTVRIKVKCIRNEPNDMESRQLAFECVTNGSDENKMFFKWTPGGQINFTVVNESAAKQFEVGKEYFVDFNVAEVVVVDAPAPAPAAEEK